MAVAGFGPDDIEITAQDNVLLVSGQRPAPSDDGRRSCTAASPAAPSSAASCSPTISGSRARTCENGLLHVALKREVPEALKPRRIAIRGGSAPRAIEGAAANAPGRSGTAAQAA